jgi:2-dehydro-3-deoxygalactonokinase
VNPTGRGPSGAPAAAAGPPPRLIALDWGTSSLRAYLLAEHGDVLEERAQPWGIMRLPDGDFAKAFRAMAGEWLDRHPRLPVIAAGMIGSAQGWREVPYQPCPAGFRDLAAGLCAVAAGDGVTLHIVPGVKQEAGLPNVMRGEETQVIGALEIMPAMHDSARLVMPGTHSKWVDVRQGRIQSFTTSMTGELFAVLRDHSILGRPARDAALQAQGSGKPTGAAATGSGQQGTEASASFARGVATARDSNPPGIMPLLFSARTLVLTGALAAADSLDYLSGMLIGEELRCALAHRGAADGHMPAALVGDPALCRRYAQALALYGLAEVPIIDATSKAGLWRIAAGAGLAGDGA